MKVQRITLREIRMPLVTPFETSFGRVTDRRMLLVEAESDGVAGWGESRRRGGALLRSRNGRDRVAYSARLYLAALEGARIRRVPPKYGPRSNQFAGTTWPKAPWKPPSGTPRQSKRAFPSGNCSAECARKLPCGVSIGIKETLEELVATVERELAAGYQRIKIKIKPGNDVDARRAAAPAVSEDPPDGRCQFRIPPGRLAAPETPGSLLPDDDRAAARMG